MYAADPKRGINEEKKRQEVRGQGREEGEDEDNIYARRRAGFRWMPGAKDPDGP